MSVRNSIQSEARAQSLPTERGVAPESLAEGIKLEMYPSRNEQTLTSIRGIHDDRSLPLESLVRSSSFARDHRAELSQIWVKARIDPKLDQGQDLKALLPLLEKHPELLERMHAIATTDRLFGKARSSENGASFDKMRSEFLAELIRGAVDSRAITQGPGPMCTAASMLKALPPEELLRVGSGFALDGVVATRGGKEMVMRSDFLYRAEDGSAGHIEDIRCRRPSAGMLMLLDGVIELGVPDVTKQGGSFWWQYTDAWRNLRGCEVACAARDATIEVSRLTGEATRESGIATTTMSQMEYLINRLERSKTGVLIDTEWDHSRSGTGSDSMHARHMLRAVGVEQRGGTTFVVCENPIGDFVDTTRSSRGHAEFFAPGTILGHKDKFWFETGEQGLVYIRQDVLSAHLQNILVDYGDTYTFVKGHETTPLSLGTLDKTTPIIRFVNGDTVIEEVAGLVDVRTGELVVHHAATEQRKERQAEKKDHHAKRRHRVMRRGRSVEVEEGSVPDQREDGAFPESAVSAMSEALKSLGKKGN
jgi:hypothetical protein